MAAPATAALSAIPRVNLLPPSEVSRREREKLAGKWIWAGIGAVILAAVLVAGAWLWNQFAQLQLAAEQARTTTLIQQIGALSEVSGAIATEKELHGYLAEAMGSDLGWQEVRGKLESVLPNEVQLTGFELTAGAPAATKLAEESAAAATGLQGTITLDSPNTIDIATISRSLRQVEGIMLSDANAITGSSLAEGHYTYTIDVVFDQSIYTGRFAADPAEGANG